MLGYNILYLYGEIDYSSISKFQIYRLEEFSIIVNYGVCIIYMVNNVYRENLF